MRKSVAFKVQVKVSLSSEKVAELFNRAVGEGSSDHWCKAIRLTNEGMKVYRETNNVGLAMLHGFYPVGIDSGCFAVDVPGWVSAKMLADGVKSISEDAIDLFASVLVNEFASPLEGDWFLQTLVFGDYYFPLSEDGYLRKSDEHLKVLAPLPNENENPEALDPIGQIHG